MPIQHAVLGLLAENSSYGYEIKATVEATMGPQWGEINIGHVYQTLDRLARDGLVASEPVRSSGHRDRVIHQITQAGRNELADWLAAPAERRSGYRDEFFLKLAVAARTGRSALAQIVDRQRRYQLGQLKNLVALRQQPPTEPLVALLIEAAALHGDADLQLLEIIEQRLDLLASTSAQPSRRVSPQSNSDTAAG